MSLYFLGAVVSMKKILGILLRFLLALIMGACIALFILQRDVRFKHTVEGHIKNLFATSYASDIACNVTSINLLRPSITLEAIVVTPNNGETGWQWTARTATVSSSWIKSLFAKALPLTIHLEDGRSDSEIIDKKPAVIDHLYRLFAPPDVGIPIFLKSLHIVKSFFRLSNDQLALHCPVQIDMERIGNSTKVSCYPTDAQLIYQQRTYAEDVQGSVLMEFTEGLPVPYTKVDLNGTLPWLAPEQTKFFCYGTWQQGRGTFSLHNSDRSFVIDPLHIDENFNIDVALVAPVAAMQNIVSAQAAHIMNGRCSAHMVANLRDPLHSLRADCALHNGSLKGITLPTTQFVVSADKVSKVPSGIIDIQVPAGSFSGSWQWDQSHGGTLSLKNNMLMSVPLSRYWKLQPQDIEMRIAVDLLGTLTVAGSCTLTHDRLKTKMKGDGAVTIHGTDLHGSVHLGRERIELDADLASHKVKRAEYTNEAGLPLAKINMQANGLGWKGFFDYGLILSCLPKSIRDELSGQGVFTIDLERTGNSQLIKGSISLAGGAIKLPQLYNFMTALNADVQIDVVNRAIAINDLKMQFNRGAIHSKRLSFHLTDQFVPSFIYAPFIIEDLFVSWRHDIFGILSGMLTFELNNSTPLTAKGLLFIDRTQINIGNIFNQQMIGALPSSAPAPSNEDMQLDIALKTRDHCTIQTGVVDAQAKADLAIVGNVQQPIISGAIDIVSGQLKFPYKPLHITHGKLYFLPNQLQDPLLEITAKNKIKKYQITLQVNGSAQSPHIHVESDPTLTEEQVLALLFAGVEDSSLNVLMPTLVTQSMQQVVFGQNKNELAKNKFANYFKSWLKPLSHVRIVPRFNDEGGRGGLRGAIEIEVNDDLEAVIEKNFSLPEDTRINVEYSISDDVSVRGIKDEHGSLGGEMEVRWKF